jgi:hypothetical protein
MTSGIIRTGLSASILRPSSLQCRFIRRNSHQPGMSSCTALSLAAIFMARQGLRRKSALLPSPPCYNRPQRNMFALFSSLKNSAVSSKVSPVVLFRMSGWYKHAICRYLIFCSVSLAPSPSPNIFRAWHMLLETISASSLSSSHHRGQIR